jgi:hypothetical protein
MCQGPGKHPHQWAHGTRHFGHPDVSTAVACLYPRPAPHKGYCPPSWVVFIWKLLEFLWMVFMFVQELWECRGLHYTSV